MNDDELRRKLGRLGAHVTGHSPAPKQTSVTRRYQRLADTLGGKLQDDPSGVFCQVTETYPTGHAFGTTVVPDNLLGREVELSSFSAGEVEGRVRLSDLLFFDLETTGLGGAGTVAFLVGCGSLTKDGFEVRQYVLPDYSDEVALLEHWLTEFSENTTLVTYNGASFDLNVIRDRLIMNRVARELPTESHIDLLHPSRRLYRRRLKDCSLTNLERELFGFYRVDDVPGYLIPSTYFDWLNSEDTTYLPQVLEHNRLDILTMLFVLLELSEAFASDGESLSADLDRYSLSRVYGRRKQPDRSLKTLDKALDSEGLTPDAKLFRSMMFKKTAQWEEAVGLWQSLSEEEAPERFHACIELAKYFEHRIKDVRRAYDFARLAQSSESGSPSARKALRYRLNRLHRKLKEID